VYSKKQTIQNTAKQNYPNLVTSYDTRPGNEVGLFYNAPDHIYDVPCICCYCLYERHNAEQIIVFLISSCLNWTVIKYVVLFHEKVVALDTPCADL